MEIAKTYTLNGLEIKLSTGELAKLAQGAVLLQLGGTSVLATTTVAKESTEQDFFPLSVEYIEKMYARGAINGSRFQKREGLPSDDAMIKARQVDHSIRSLFPKSFRRPTSVVLTVLSYDQVNDPEILAVLGASISITLANMPFYGPCSGVIACVDAEGNIILNPTVEGREEYMAEFLITGVDDKLLSIEGWGKEVSDEKMDEILDAAMDLIKEMNAMQRNFAKAVNAEEVKKEEGPSDEYNDITAPEALIEKVISEKKEEIKSALYIDKDKVSNRYDNLNKIKTELEEEYAKMKEANPDAEVFSRNDVSNAVEYVARKVVREGVLKESKRVTKRALDEIRPLSARVDILPTVHGSALFNRGLTQSLSIVTLGSLKNGQMIDDMEGESEKRFFHHYNMPPFSTGEAGRYNYHPGRREIGHGAIGENALKNMIPNPDKFPYTIRVVSEILSSNGSTSMAATCASSMALMAAGVPLKAPVAGIGVGLVTDSENPDNFKLLLDIEGIEDFYGDMDFKVTGTETGITAIQYENKLRGVKLNIIKEGIKLAHKGRLEVLKVMEEAIAAPRSQLSDNAPIVEVITIKTDKIGELIGPGGKNIKDLVQRAEEYAKSSVDVSIEDDGKVTITAANRAQLNFIKQTINEMFEEPVVGKEYAGYVDKIMPYGVFVNVTSNISGLCHISEIFKQRTEANLEKIFEPGQKVRVIVQKVEDGRINFTMKDLEQSPELQEKLNHPEQFPAAPMQERSNDRRFGGRDRDRRDSRRSRF